MSPNDAAPDRLSRAPLRRAGARGSVLIVAMLLAAIIAISLGSYIKLAINSMEQADRSYYLNSAVNLAEMGIEEALYAYNQLDDVATPADAWPSASGWTIAADNSVSRTLPAFAPGPGVTGSVRVYCSRYNPDSTTPDPVIVSKATVTFPNGSQSSKYVEVKLRKRALWALGVVVRETIRSSGGNLYVDSWNSDPDRDPSTPPVPYSLGIANAKGSLATTSSANGAIDIAGGAVYGTISMGGSAEPNYNKNNGVLSNTLGGTGFDRNLVLNDFTAVFPPITVPTPVTTNPIASSLGSGITLPQAGDLAAGDGYYYYSFAPGANIAYNGGTLTVSDKVVLIFNNHSGSTTINIGGNGSLSVANGAELKIYSNGDISLGGGGLANSNPQPYTCVIYGTHGTPGGQTMTLAGNGSLTAAVFAPNADLTVGGGGASGHMYGAMVANSARVTGNTRFHYDEALANLTAGNPYGIAKWRELQTSDERGLYAAQLSF